MPDPSTYPDLDALLKGAKDALARANALDGSLPPGSESVYNPRNAAPAVSPAPVDDSLWGRIKRVANYSPLPENVGEQFSDQVDSTSTRDSKALAGTYGPLDTLKSALAGSGGGFFDELRSLATPAGLASLVSPETRGGSVVRGLSRAVSTGASALFAGEGADDLANAADPAAKARGALNLLLGLHGAASGLSDVPVPGDRGPAKPPLKVERYSPNTSAADHLGDPSAAALPFSTGVDPHMPNTSAAPSDVPLDFEQTPAPSTGVDRYMPNTSASPSARFAFHQDDFNGGSFPMFNIEGGPAHGSTVSAETLAEHNIPTPDVPQSDAASIEQPPAVAPPAPDTRSPLARLLQPRVSAAEAADNLAQSGSLLGSPHAADEVAGMEREFGDPLPEVARQLKARRQVEHMEASRNNARYDYLTAPDAGLDGPPPPSTPPPSTPPQGPKTLKELLQASVDASTPPPGRDGHFTLPKPSTRLQDYLNHRLDAQDRALGREPLSTDTAAPAQTPVNMSAPIVDDAGRVIAGPQEAVAARPEGPWDHNSTGTVPTPDAPPVELPKTGTEGGFADPTLLRQLLRIPAGAAAGAVFDPENRERGALLGGGLGAASLVPGLPEKAERLRYFSMLAGPAPVKKILSDTGVVLNTAGERAMTHGPAAGGRVLKEFFSPTTVQDAVSKAGVGHGDPSVLMDQPTSTSYAGVLGTPPRLMGAATEATRGALERAGVDDAASRTFTSEPSTKTGKAALQFQRSSKLARLLLPFAKTAINQVEGGTVPIYKALTQMGDMDPAGRKQLLAKLGMLGASGAAGAALGNTDFAHDHPYLAPVASLIAGPGAVEFGAAEQFAHAMHTGKNEPQALGQAATEVTHQLPTPSEWATNPSELLASLAPAGLRSLNRLIDPVDRDTSGSVFGALLKRLPWLSQTLPPKHKASHDYTAE